MTVPAGQVWAIHSVVAKLVTSATVATRNPYLIVGDGSTTFARVVPYLGLTASQTGLYSWYPSAPALQAGTDSQNGLPDLVLPAGWTLAVSTTGLAAGDQWSNVALGAIVTMVQSGTIDISELPELVVQIAGGRMG